MREKELTTTEIIKISVGTTQLAQTSRIKVTFQQHQQKLVMYINFHGVLQTSL